MALGWLKKLKQKGSQPATGEAPSAAFEEPASLNLEHSGADLEESRIEVPETEVSANISCAAEAELDRSAFVVSMASAPAAETTPSDDLENHDLTCDDSNDEEVALFNTRAQATLDAEDGAIEADAKVEDDEGEGESATDGAEEEGAVEVVANAESGKGEMAEIVEAVDETIEDGVEADDIEAAAAAESSKEFAAAVAAQDAAASAAAQSGTAGAVEANRPAVIDDELLNSLVSSQQVERYEGKTLADRTSLWEKFVCVALAFSLCLMTWNETSIAEARELILGPDANLPASSAAQPDDAQDGPDAADTENDDDASGDEADDADESGDANGDEAGENGDEAAAEPEDETETADDPANDDPRAEAMASYLPENLVEADKVLPKLSDELAKDAPEQDAKLKNLANTKEDDLKEALADALQLRLETSGALLASDGSFHVAATDDSGKLMSQDAQDRYDAAERAAANNDDYRLPLTSVDVSTSFGNLPAQLLDGGYLGGMETTDVVALTFAAPFLYVDAEGNLVETLSEEEWKLETEGADESIQGMRAKLSASDIPAGWTVWTEHDGKYQKRTKGDLEAGLSGTIVFRYEGVQDEHGVTVKETRGRLASDAPLPQLQAGLEGNIPAYHPLAITAGYTVGSLTPGRDKDGEKADAVAYLLEETDVDRLWLENAIDDIQVESTIVPVGTPIMNRTGLLGLGGKSGFAGFLVSVAPTQGSFVEEGYTLRLTDLPDFKDKGGLDAKDIRVMDVTALTLEERAQLAAADPASLEALKEFGVPVVASEVEPGVGEAYLDLTVDADGNDVPESARTLNADLDSEDATDTRGARNWRILYVAVPYSGESLSADDADAFAETMLSAQVTVNGKAKLFSSVDAQTASDRAVAQAAEDSATAENYRAQAQAGIMAARRAATNSANYDDETFQIPLRLPEQTIAFEAAPEQNEPSDENQGDNQGGEDEPDSDNQGGTDEPVNPDEPANTDEPTESDQPSTTEPTLPAEPYYPEGDSDIVNNILNSEPREDIDPSKQGAGVLGQAQADPSLDVVEELGITNAFDLVEDGFDFDGYDPLSVSLAFGNYLAVMAASSGDYCVAPNPTPGLMLSERYFNPSMSFSGWTSDLGNNTYLINDASTPQFTLQIMTEGTKGFFGGTSYYGSNFYGTISDRDGSYTPGTGPQFSSAAEAIAYAEGTDGFTSSFTDESEKLADYNLSKEDLGYSMLGTSLTVQMPFMYVNDQGGLESTYDFGDWERKGGGYTKEGSPKDMNNAPAYAIAFGVNAAQMLNNWSVYYYSYTNNKLVLLDGMIESGYNEGDMQKIAAEAGDPWVLDAEGNLLSGLNFAQGYTGQFKFVWHGHTKDSTGQIYTQRMDLSGLSAHFPNFGMAVLGYIPENSGGTIRLGGEVGIMTNGTRYYYPEGRRGTPLQATIGVGYNGGVREIKVLKTNLKWESSYEKISNNVLYDRYNYMVYRVDTENQSKGSSEIDSLEYFLNVFNTRENNNQGMTPEDLMTWLHVADDISNPARNPLYVGDGTGDVPEGASKDLYQGIPNQGGILIYNTTDWLEQDYAELNKRDFSNLDSIMERAYNRPKTMVPTTETDKDGKPIDAYMLEIDDSGDDSFEIESTYDPDTGEPIINAVSMPYRTNGMSGMVNFTVAEAQGAAAGTADHYGYLGKNAKNGQLFPENRLVPEKDAEGNITDKGMRARDHYSFIIAVPYTTNISLTSGAEGDGYYVTMDPITTIRFGKLGLDKDYTWSDHVSSVVSKFGVPTSKTELNKQVLETYQNATGGGTAVSNNVIPRPDGGMTANATNFSYLGYPVTYIVSDLKTFGNMPLYGLVNTINTTGKTSTMGPEIVDTLRELLLPVQRRVGREERVLQREHRPGRVLRPEQGRLQGPGVH